jgi:hypothetical protein
VVFPFIVDDDDDDDADADACCLSHPSLSNLSITLSTLPSTLLT